MGCNFVPIGVIDKDYPLAAKLFFGNRPFSFHQDETSISLAPERGASLHFNQQPNAMISITLHHPYVSDDSPFNGLDLGLIRPHKLLKKCYQRRLSRILVTSMENYSFAGNPSCIDKGLMLWYNEIYPQIKEGRVCERKLSAHLWACFKWLICAIVGGYIAGHEASKFPTTIKDSQFERYVSTMDQGKEELSSIKQELLKCTNDSNKKLDSLNQILVETLKEQTAKYDVLYRYLIKTQRKEDNK